MSRQELVGADLEYEVKGDCNCTEDITLRLKFAMPIQVSNVDGGIQAPVDNNQSNNDRWLTARVTDCSVQKITTLLCNGN